MRCAEPCTTTAAPSPRWRTSTPTPDVRDAARAAGQEQSAFEIDLTFRAGLYDRVRAFSATPGPRR